MFAALYFVQGVIQAYQLNFFKPHMDAEGIDADRVIRELVQRVPVS